LRILKLLCEPGILEAQAGLHALAVNQKVLEERSHDDVRSSWSNAAWTYLY
jgi:hypothetical protein